MKNEIRNFSLKETRAEVKEQEGKRFLVGKIPYDSLSQDLGGFKEIIKRGAFSKTLQDGADVRALVNHDDSRILGRIKNSTLQLEDREDGLYCTVELGSQSYANDLWESIQRDDVNTLSFGFRVIKDTWTNDSGKQLRYLNEVQLFEVSFGVVFPAYEATDSQAVYRSLYSQSGLNFDLINAALAKIQNEEELTPEEEEALKAIGGLVKNEETTVTEEEPRTSALSVLEQELTLLELDA